MTIKKKQDGTFEKIETVERKRPINKDMLLAEKERLQERIVELDSDIAEIEAAESGE